MISLKTAEFLKSASRLDHAPPDVGLELAFVGRSNAGKSSAINAILGRKIARTSKTPGQTQLMNFFQLNALNRLVDLPGYGFAKVPEKIRLQIEHILESYLSQRRCLKGLVMLMDIRRPLTLLDEQLLQLALSYELPVHILLTKCDKISRGAAQQQLLAVREATRAYVHVSAQTFSALQWIGVEEAQAKLQEWLKASNAPHPN